jgi:hypothetical protein
MFTTIEQRFERHVVIPDIHGEVAHVRRVVDEYVAHEDVGFVFLGDVIDRKGLQDDPEQGVRKTLELIRQLGDRAIMTLANHEIYLLASVLSTDPERRDGYRQLWLEKPTSRNGGNSSIEQNTASSYDLTNDGPTTAPRLWREMRAHQHTKVLTNATPYYETETFIAVHAGLRYDQNLEQQRAEMEATAYEMSCGIFHDTPDQWFSIELAIDARDNPITDKTIVSGHAHYRIPNGRYRRTVTNFSSERVLHDGRRVRLASQLNAPVSEPLYIWQDWDGKVIRVPR